MLHGRMISLYITHQGSAVVQEEAVTVIAAGDVDPQSTAASVALTSLQLAQTEGTQASSQGRPGLPSQGGGAGILSLDPPSICASLAPAGMHLFTHRLQLSCKQALCMLQEGVRLQVLS